ncbi:MAG: undecaprenyl-diphosphatase UppP [Chloroflexi bacterium]|nr:undecaprenyl-diphosphatase UppP [Chloroflexota bacterium]
MDIIQAMILGIVQGLTEFAPVSSSAHLVLVPWALGWREPGLTFDTVLHLGTLVAVLAVFWREILAIVEAWLGSFVGRGQARVEARLAWLLIVGTIPAAILGYLFKDFFEELFSRPLWVGGFLLITALALVVAERYGDKRDTTAGLTLPKSLLIGLAQAFAIAPGISRSGSTISMGMIAGLARAESARFSFLLSVPIILGAAASQLKDLFDEGGPDTVSAPLVVGFLAAAVSGYLCINFLLRYLRSRSLHVFAAYCAVVGTAVVAVGLAK